MSALTVTLLGTGPAEAIPRAGHTDPACQDARRGGKSRRTRSAALVVHGRTSVLIDAGPDIRQQLAREAVRKLTAVCLTHAHADACGGLADLNQWLAQTRSNPLPLLANAGTLQRLRARSAQLTHLVPTVTRQFKGFRVTSLNIIPFPVHHSLQPGFPTSGFKIGNGLIYASDVASLPARSQKLLHHADTAILDGAMYFHHSLPAHLGVDEAIRIANDLEIKHLVLTQISHTYPPHRIAAREIIAYWRRQRQPFPQELTLAFDGLQLIAS